MTNVVIKTSHSAEHCLVDAVWHSYITLKLRISSLANHSQNQGVFRCHVLTNVGELVNVSSSLSVYPQLFSKAGVVWVEQFELHKLSVTF